MLVIINKFKERKYKKYKNIINNSINSNPINGNFHTNNYFYKTNDPDLFIDVLKTDNMFNCFLYKIIKVEREYKGLIYEKKIKKDLINLLFFEDCPIYKKINLDYNNINNEFSKSLKINFLEKIIFIDKQIEMIENKIIDLNLKITNKREKLEEYIINKELFNELINYLNILELSELKKLNSELNYLKESKTDTINEFKF